MQPLLVSKMNGQINKGPLRGEELGTTCTNTLCAEGADCRLPLVFYIEIEILRTP